MIKYNDLAEDEQIIEEEMEKLRPISEEKKEKIEKIIEKAKKNRAISLRISNYDLEKLKDRAKKEGVPYQTLINMILHKYVTNCLIEKEEIIKMIDILKERDAI